MRENAWAVVPRLRSWRRMVWRVVFVGLPLVAVLAWLDWRTTAAAVEHARADRLRLLAQVAAIASADTVTDHTFPAVPQPRAATPISEIGAPGTTEIVDPTAATVRTFDAEGHGTMWRFDPAEIAAPTRGIVVRSTMFAVACGLLGMGLVAGATHLGLARRLDRLARETATRLDFEVVEQGDELETLTTTLRRTIDLLETSCEDRARLAMVAERTTSAVVMTDRDRRITWVNEAFTDITGYTLDEVVGRVPGHILQCEESDPATVRRIREGLERRESIRETIFNRAKDGRGYWLTLDIHPVFDDDGDLSGFLAVESDVTELKSMQERLAQTERRLRMVIEGAELGTWDWNIQTGEVVFNERWCRMLGYEPEEIEPHVRSWELVVHPEDMDEAMHALQDHFEGRAETYRCEHRLRHKDGTAIWVLDAGRVYEWDEDGRPLKAAGIHVDITDARETALRYELAAAGASVGIWDWDLVSGDVHLSANWKAILGYAPDELPDTYESWHDNIHPQDRDRVISALERHLHTHSPYDIQFRMRHRDGTDRWTHARGQAAWGFDGKAIRVAGSLADVHDRKLAELAHERLAAIVEQSEDAILGLALDGTIVIANPACATLFARPVEELVGRHESMLVPAKDRQAELDHTERVAAGERVPSREGFRLRADGSEVEVSVATSVVRDDEGRVVGFAKIVRDITERREKRALQESHAALARLNTLLAHQNARLEEMTDRAHRFVDDVSHEFRTPLTVIKEYASLILDGLGGPVTDEQQDWLRTIDVATVDLNTMVEDFLDSSKLRAGRLRVDRRPVAVPEILDNVERLLSRKAEAADITLTIAAAPDLPEVFADPEKARRVVMNLATNAIKFSPRGSEVRITTRRLEEEIEISIHDQGPGLDRDDLATLFQRFHQLPNAMSPSVKGFGLGLNIARQLVWLNLGRIDVDSEPGRGSTFRFTIPIHHPVAIVDRFLCVQRQREDWPDRLAVAEIVPARSRETDRIRQSLCGASAPTDIKIVSRAGDRIVVFGPTDDADLWEDRLRRMVADEFGDDATEITVRGLGSFAFPEDGESARRTILNTLGHSKEILRA